MPETSQSQAATPAGQRRRATILFADMEASTQLAEQLGEEAAYDVVRSVIGVLTDAVESNGGTVQEVMGDGIMALFGAPAAIEDAPLAACRSAIAIHDGIGGLGGNIEAKYGTRPRVRVGLHSGYVVVGEIGRDGSGEVTAIGDAVNVASRLQDSAEPGTTILSETLCGLVSDYTDTTALGARTLKGKSKPQQLFRLEGVRADASRFGAANARGLTRLVGRSDELGFLLEAWRAVRGGGRDMVAVTGEAGVGKSRLIHEFRQRLEAEDAFVLEGHCVGDRKGQPFLPFIEVVRTSFRIAPDTSAARARDKLERGLQVLGIEAEPVEPYLLNLLGFATDDSEFHKLDHEVVGSRTRNAVLEMLRARCRISPTVLVIEDLHWVDSASIGVVERILADRELAQLLLVYTSRSAFPGEKTATVRDIVLKQLSAALSEDLIRSRLGVESIPPGLSELVRGKAEGNPLFAEEILNYLLETEQLQVSDGQAVLTNAATRPAVPISIENMLMDRVDRLPESARALLEAAAVFGRTFDVDLVSRVADLASDGSLDALRSRDVIVGRGKTRYAFKHALLRDAVYDSLLTERRRMLHERTAEAIERSSSVADAVQMLAHHWSRAYRADKAVPALARAGEDSLRIYSLDEADSYFSEALELMDSEPDTADETLYVDLLLRLARISYFRGRFSAIIKLVERHLPRVEALDDQARLARFLFEGGYARVFHGKAEEGKAWLERSMAIADRTNSEIARGYAALGLSWYYVFWPPPQPGNWERICELCSLAIETGEQASDVWLVSKAMLSLANGGQFHGRPNEAEHWAGQLLKLSERTNDPRPRCTGLYALSIGAVVAGEGEKAIDLADEALRIALAPADHFVATSCKSYGLALVGRTRESVEILAPDHIQELIEDIASFRLQHMIVQGLWLIVDGEVGKGVAKIRGSLKELDAHNNLLGRCFARQALGDVYLALLQSDERPTLKTVMKNLVFLVAAAPRAATLAVRWYEDLRSVAVEADAPSCQAMALLRLGQVAALRGDDARAKTYLDEARAIASEVEARTIVGEVDVALSGLKKAAA